MRPPKRAIGNPTRIAVSDHDAGTKAEVREGLSNVQRNTDREAPRDDVPTAPRPRVSGESIQSPSPRPLVDVQRQTHEDDAPAPRSRVSSESIQSPSESPSVKVEREALEDDAPAPRSRVSSESIQSPSESPPVKVEREAPEDDAPAPKSRSSGGWIQSPSPGPPLDITAMRRVSITASDHGSQNKDIERSAAAHTSIKQPKCDNASTTHRARNLAVDEPRGTPHQNNAKAPDRGSAENDARISQPEGQRSWPRSPSLLPQSLDYHPLIERSSHGQSRPLVTAETLLSLPRPAPTATGAAATGAAATGAAATGAAATGAAATGAAATGTTAIGAAASIRRRHLNSGGDFKILVEDTPPSPSSVVFLQPDQVALLESPPENRYRTTLSNLIRLVTLAGLMCRQCPNMLRYGISTTRRLIRLLHEVSTLLAYMFEAFLTLFGLLLIILAFWLTLWALGMIFNGLDHLAMVCCQWTWLRPICTFFCGKAPWLGYHLFSFTCTFPAQQAKFGIGSPYTEPEAGIISRIGDIGPLLLDQQSRCMEFQASFPRVWGRVPISEVIKDELVVDTDGLCSFLLRMAETIPGHFQYVNVFGKTILRDVTTTGQRIDNALMTTDPRGLLVEQRLIHERAEHFIKSWIKDYHFLADPGKALAAEITDFRKKNAHTHFILKKALTNTEKARQDGIKKWPLSVRLGRRLNLLGLDPSELDEYNEAVEILIKWSTNTRPGGPLEVVLNSLQNNVTSVNVELNALASTRFTADFQFQMGPDGLREVQEWFKGVETHIRGLGDGGNLAG